MTNNPYRYMHRSLKMLADKRINVVWIMSRPGLGKTYQVDAMLDQLKSPHVVFTGDMTPAYVHRFLYANNNKIIVFRDVAKLLRRLSMIDTLKSLTESKEKRTISYLKCEKKVSNESSLQMVGYAQDASFDDDTPPTFDFTGQIVFEMNAKMKRYLADSDALFSRGRFVELVFSDADIIHQMNKIAQKGWEKTVTKYIVEHHQGELNFRLQHNAFVTFEAARADKLSWRSEVKLMLENDTTESRKYLYRTAGNKPIKRISFVRFLMSQGMSYATAQRRITEWLVIRDIHSNGLHKQAMLSLKPFR